MFARALPYARELGPRGTAQAILGSRACSLRRPMPTETRSALDRWRWSTKLVERYRNHATDEWRWFEPTLTYDNALLPLALFAALRDHWRARELRVARESLEFLEDVCFDGDRLQLVGNTGGTAAAAKRPEQTSRPSTRPRSCSRSAARTRSPQIGTTCAACASRSRGSSAPTASACRCTISRPAAAATAWAWRTSIRTKAPRARSASSVAARDAGARRRGSRARRRVTDGRRSHDVPSDQAHTAPALAGRPPRARQTVPARRGDVCCPGQSRAHLLMARILAIPEAEVAALNATIAAAVRRAPSRSRADVRSAISSAGGIMPPTAACRPTAGC